MVVYRCFLTYICIATLNCRCIHPKGVFVEGLDVGLVISNRNEVVPDKHKDILKVKLPQPAGGIRHREMGHWVVMTGFQE